MAMIKPLFGSHLELRNERLDGLRHYLDGKPVHDGAALEFLTYEGWMAGRYEWSFQRADVPHFYCYHHDNPIPITSEDLLRWPLGA